MCTTGRRLRWWCVRKGWILIHCNTLQHTATHCNTLQHTATHCNILHHRRLRGCCVTEGWKLARGGHFSRTLFNLTETVSECRALVRVPMSACEHVPMSACEHVPMSPCRATQYPHKKFWKVCSRLDTHTHTSSCQHVCARTHGRRCRPPLTAMRHGAYFLIIKKKS